MDWQSRDKLYSYRYSVSLRIFYDDVNIPFTSRKRFDGKVSRCSYNWTGWFNTRPVSTYSKSKIIVPVNKN